MPVTKVDLEAAIKRAIPVTHLEIEDQSSGCGDNYAIILVSDVRILPSSSRLAFISFQAFQGMSTLARHRMGDYSFHFKIHQR